MMVVITPNNIDGDNINNNNNQNNNTDDDDDVADESGRSSIRTQSSTYNINMLDESISNLSQSTQSLLRTARLDIVVLGSQCEDMKETLVQLESQWEMLQKLLAEDAERTKLEGEEKGKKAGRGGGKVMASTIDWDGDNNNSPRGVSNNTNNNIFSVPTGSSIKENKKKGKFGESVQLQEDQFDWGALSTDGSSMVQDVIDQEEEEARRASTGNMPNNINDEDDYYNKQQRGLFGLFKRRDSMPQQQQQRSQSCDEGSSGGKTKWSLFGNNNSSSEPPHHQNGLQKLLFRRNSDIDTSCTTGERTVETQPQDSPTSSRNTDASSSDNNNNNNETNNIGEEEEDAEVIQALQVKLKGCDSAASTLHQLLTFQKRALYDLQYQRTILSSASTFNSKHHSFEIEKLTSQLHHAKVERRRKARQLEDVKNKKKKSDDQEERLRDELETVRSELFRLRMEVSKDEQLVMHAEQQQQQEQEQRGDGGGHGHQQ